jgi:hypothetical protein
MAMAASLALAATGAAHAKPCRDAAGHYVTCPAGATASTTTSKSTTSKSATGKSTTGKSTTAAENTASGAAKTAKSTTKQATGSMAAAAAPAAGKNASAHATAPAGAVTAKCKDGTVSHSQHRSGTCANHGGVASWM